MANGITNVDPELINALVLKGDLSGLSANQKVQYYKIFCDRLGLDPLTQPFKLLKLQGKEILYCDRSGAQQLNKLHGVSHEIRSRELIDAAGVYQVTARASMPEGRFEDSIGAVNIQGLKGDAYANAIMKAETKAKRRATLDLLGLGILDETETETIPGAVTTPLIAESNGHFEDLRDVDDLHKEYMELFNAYVLRSGDPENAKAFHPDNWKKDRNADNYVKAINAIRKRLHALSVEV
jgi:hypothetical protein